MVRLIATGLSNEQIAERLFISPLTAKTHVTRSLGKLGVRDRVQLVILAYETGLVRARVGWREARSWNTRPGPWGTDHPGDAGPPAPRSTDRKQSTERHHGMRYVTSGVSLALCHSRATACSWGPSTPFPRHRRRPGPLVPHQSQGGRAGRAVPLRRRRGQPQVQRRGAVEDLRPEGLRRRAGRRPCPGYHDLASEPDSGAMDYLRHPELVDRTGVLFERRPPSWLQELLDLLGSRPWHTGTNVDAADALEPMLVRPADPRLRRTVHRRPRG